MLPLKSGKFLNVLLGQTIALSLNVRLDPFLPGFELSETFCTAGLIPGTDGVLGVTPAGPDLIIGTADDYTSDDAADMDDVQMFEIPASVLEALASEDLGIDSVTVGGLLELANRALAGLDTGGASLPDINKAVDAINRGFDECRIPLACSVAALTEVVRPVNDDYENALDITSVTSLTHGCNENASRQANEPLHAGEPGGKSIWWKWTAPQSCHVTIGCSRSDFDTLLAVYQGDTLDSQSLVAANDDNTGVGSELRFFCEAGRSYHLAVDGYYGSAGDVCLSIVLDAGMVRTINLKKGGQLTIGTVGPDGTTYTVEVSSDLKTWHPIGSSVLQNGVLEVVDQNESNLPMRFYRLTLAP